MEGYVTSVCTFLEETVFLVVANGLGSAYGAQEGIDSP